MTEKKKTEINKWLGMVWFTLVLWHINHCGLFNAKASLYIYMRYIWFRLGWVLWHINHCRLFNAKSSFHIYMRYIWFRLGWVLWHINHCRLFNAKSSFHIYMRYIWFRLGWVLWHINHCRLFNAKSSFNIYMKYIWFDLVGFYGILTIAGYLMPNPIYTYILDIYDSIWLGFKAYQPL